LVEIAAKPGPRPLGKFRSFLKAPGVASRRMKFHRLFVADRTGSAPSLSVGAD